MTAPVRSGPARCGAKPGRRGPSAGWAVIWAVLISLSPALAGCAGPRKTPVKMTVTAYSDDRISCSWERGSWKYLKLDFWNRYVSAGPGKGRRYTGRTASGTRPHEYHPGLVSMDSLRQPWMIPFRVVFFPWLFLERPGTVAADTRHYPFGTVIDIPGYGVGVVEDRGGAIKGPARLDVFYRSRSRALRWGRQEVEVRIHGK